MQVTNKYAIENNIAIEEIFQIAISQYTKNADKLAIEEEISNFLFFDTFFTNRFTGNFWIIYPDHLSVSDTDSDTRFFGPEF